MSKSKKYRKYNAVIMRLVIMVAASLILGWLSILLFKGPLNLIQDADLDFCIRRYYNRFAHYDDKNVNVDRVPKVCDPNVANIVIVEAGNKDNSQMAVIISRLMKKDPAVIGLDISYRRDDKPIDSIDRMLIDTIRKYKDRIVLAVHDDNGVSLRSFNKELQSDGIKEGSVLMDSSYSRYNEEVVYQSGTIKKFSYQVVEEYRRCHSLVWEESFQNAVTDLRPFCIDDTLHRMKYIECVEKEKIEGKIVLITSTDVYYDRVTMPFSVVNPIQKCKGTTVGGGWVLACEIRSLMAHLRNQETNDSYRQHNVLVRMSQFSNFLLCLIVLCIHSISVLLISRIIPFFSKKIKRSSVKILVKIIAVVFEWILILLLQWFVIWCFLLIVDKFQLIPNVVVLMSSILLNPISLKIALLAFPVEYPDAS